MTGITSSFWVSSQNNNLGMRERAAQNAASTQRSIARIARMLAIVAFLETLSDGYMHKK